MIEKKKSVNNTRKIIKKNGVHKGQQKMITNRVISNIKIIMDQI